MEVKSEESESNEFQIYENRPGIPRPYRPSGFCRETHLQGIPTVRGVPIPQPWIFVPGRGRGVYAHAIDEII